MANYEGAARSNYVRIKDIAALKAALEPFAIEVSERGTNGTVCFLSEDGDGGWPSTTLTDNDVEIEFDPVAHICPHMVDGEVLVMLESGHERLRYIVGYADAYHSDGRRVGVNIENIYDKASREFDVPLDRISQASY